MSQHPSLTHDQLRSIHLLRDFGDDGLHQLAGLFRPLNMSEGQILFEPGQTAEAFYFLARGEVALEDSNERHTLFPPSVIGELGAVTGTPRRTRAIAGKDTALWELPADALLTFLQNHPDLSHRFFLAMLNWAAEKIGMDVTRLDDMRANIIRTQKAMKRMRDFLLESQDTVVSRPIHGILDGLIQQNRRVNYRVAPPSNLPATVRLDGHQKAPVVEISRTHVSFRVDDGSLPETGARLSGVLTLSGPELPISGRVLRTIHRRVDFELDLMIDEFVAVLEGYLTRVQMLDVLV